MILNYNLFEVNSSWLLVACHKRTYTRIELNFNFYNEQSSSGVEDSL